MRNEGINTETELLNTLLLRSYIPCSVTVYYRNDSTPPIFTYYKRIYVTGETKQGCRGYRFDIMKK